MSRPCAPEPTLSQLILPQTPHPQSITRKVTSPHRSIRNRLHSISADAAFVSDVASALQLPVIANERCGSWYVDPAAKSGSAYFKSTDGHAGEWAWSARRLNLAVLRVVGEGSGAVLVDSTRRGKHMPDALSKTVPIWIAVVNRLLFPECGWSHELHFPEQIVPASERAQIEARLDGFVKDAESLRLDIAILRSNLTRPMRPFWIAPNLPGASIQDASRSASSPCPSHSYYPLYLCTAFNTDAVPAEYTYVQGAGDDNESWSRGLNHRLFWSCREKLLSAPEAELPLLIDQITGAESDHKTTSTAPPRQIPAFPQVWIGSLREISDMPKDVRVVVCAPGMDEDVKRRLTGRKALLLKGGEGKNGSRKLRGELEKVPEFMKDFGESNGLLVCGLEDRDLVIGVTLALVCLYGRDNGKLLESNRSDWQLIDKTLIRRRLAAITTGMPDARPARSTLNAVNSFLMKPSDGCG